MKPFYLILTVAMVTFLTRVIPFMLFPKGSKTPKWVTYLGDMLPYSVIAMLIIYCLKDTNFTNAPFGLYEMSSVAAVVLIHLWKKNTLLSIALGTILYMVLI